MFIKVKIAALEATQTGSLHKGRSGDAVPSVCLPGPFIRMG